MKRLSARVNGGPGPPVDMAEFRLKYLEAEEVYLAKVRANMSARVCWTALVRRASCRISQSLSYFELVSYCKVKLLNDGCQIP